MSSPSESTSPRSSSRHASSPIDLLVRTAAVVVLATLGVLAALGGYLQATSNWDVVVPGKIYRSAQPSRFLVRDTLQQSHIKVIIFLSKDSDSADVAEERKVAKDLDVEFLDFPMNGDGVSEPSLYPAALAAVHRANDQGNAVLIHCHSGAQRTGGVVAAYRLLFEGESPQAVYAEMHKHGFDPRKNTALLPFLNGHMRDWADQLAGEKIIARAPATVPKIVPPDVQ